VIVRLDAPQVIAVEEEEVEEAAEGEEIVAETAEEPATEEHSEE
jgi:hypothetical protein